MQSGMIRWYDDARGFGFIAPDGGGEDLPLSYIEIQADGCFKSIGEGQKVEFDVAEGQQGVVAINVRRVFEGGTIVTVLCGDAVQVRAIAWGKPNLRKWAERLRAHGDVKETPVVVRLRAPPHELTVFDDGRAIVKGTGDEEIARGLVTKWLGVRLPE